MKLHEVLFAPCLSARPLFSCHRSIAHASARASVTGLLLVRHWSVAGLSLVCHWSVVGLLGSWPLVRVADRASLVHPSCIARASLVRHSCVARASLVCLFLFLLVCCSSVVGHGRCSACCSPVAPPACLFVGPSLSCHSSVCWSVAAGPSLMYRWSACLSITGCSCPVPVQGHRFIAHPSVRASARASVTRPSARASVTRPSLLSLTSLSVRPSAARRWSVYWSRGNWPVPGLSARSSLVRLIGSWSLACSSVAGLLFVRHWPWSSICYSCTACLSPRLSCRSFACCSAIGRLYCRSAVALSACLSARLSARPSLVWLSHGLGCRWFVAGPSVRVVHCSSV